MSDGRIPAERPFGLSVGVVCAIAGAVLVWRGRVVSGQVMVVVGAALMTAGVVAPPLLHAPNRIWWHFAQTLGWLNSRILLAVLFGLVLTPMGYLLRRCGWNPLEPPHGGTTWGEYTGRRLDPKHYDRGF